MTKKPFFSFLLAVNDVKMRAFTFLEEKRELFFIIVLGKVSIHLSVSIGAFNVSDAQPLYLKRILSSFAMELYVSEEFYCT